MSEHKASIHIRSKRNKVMDRKIIAKQGDKRYLVDLGNGTGRVVDTFYGIAYEPANLNSIIARGYWESYTEANPAVMELLK